MKTGFKRLRAASLSVLFHLTLPAIIVGDYLLHRTRLAGRLPVIPLSRKLTIAYWLARMVASLLLIPVLFASVAIVVVRAQRLSPVISFAFAGVLVLGCYWGLCRFNRNWVCVDHFSVGSAKRLVGSCVVFQVFVGPRWSPHSKHRCMRSVREACDWLEQKAAVHGVALTMITEPDDLCTLPDIPMRSDELSHPGYYEPYNYEKDGVRSHVEALQPQFVETISQRVRHISAKPDNVRMIVHVPKANLGFALPASKGPHISVNLEVCVCGRRSAPAVYAHELLHLFGAPDLYLHPWHVLIASPGHDNVHAQFLLSSSREILLAHFGHSIMCNLWSGLGRLTIDPITARWIGWREPGSEYQRAAKEMEGVIVEIFEAVTEDSRRRAKESTTHES